MPTHDALSQLASGTLAAVREVARVEIMPRYLKVAHERKSDGSLFTQADIAAQESLSRELARIAACPLLGEEMPADEQRRVWQTAAEFWCVDPIDGTSNFVNGIPYFAVSVALMRAGRPVVGVVYDPVADEAFYAEAGKGAWLNGTPLPIKLAAPERLARAIAGADLKRLSRRMAEAIGGQPPCHSHRNFGASALDWCYVAAGRFDVYVHGHQKLWDYAAGALILAEAGGHMSTLDEDDFWAGEVWERPVVAGLGESVFAEWRDWLRAHR